MEDASIHFNDFSASNHHLFGIFDGHGGIMFHYLGPEVAQFVKRHFADELLTSQEFQAE